MPGLLRWEAEHNPPDAYGDERSPGMPYRATWRFTPDGDEPLDGRLQRLTTLDARAGARHFALHAVILKRGRMPVRST